MKVQKNWPYAYGNLQKSLKELTDRLKENNLKDLKPLCEYINPKETPNQLREYIDVLTPVMIKLESSKILEDKITGMLIHRFTTDADYFKNDLVKEISIMSMDDIEFTLNSSNVSGKMTVSKQSELFSKIRSNNIEDVEEMLAKDVMLLDALNVDEWSAIHCCAAYGTPEMLEILVKYGANINAYTSGFYTPSMLAARQNNIICLEKLYNLGADMSVTNSSNCDVIDFLADHDEVLATMLGKVENATLQSDDYGSHLQVLLGDSIIYPLECC
jgi:ankyrin repeat protein